MAEARIPVDLFNPGQVFACLGFLEAADALLGDAEGSFDWSDEVDVRFVLHAATASNPVATVLQFLAEGTSKPWGPIGYDDSRPGKDGKALDAEDGSAGDTEVNTSDSDQPTLELDEVFPAPAGDRMALPVRLSAPNRPDVEIGHWSDGSSRDDFKLYAGNRSADRIARAMLFGVREKPKKKQSAGDLKTKGIAQLWETQRDDLTARPFHVVTPMGGSFNFDPRGAWTAIDAGYSLNDQKHGITASPVVEFMAAWGLEHARPNEFTTRKVRYAAWGVRLPPPLARVALVSGIPTIPSRRFRFNLDLSGKNKVIAFATPESNS